LTYISVARDDISPAPFSRCLPPLLRPAFAAVAAPPAAAIGLDGMAGHEQQDLARLRQNVLDRRRDRRVASVIAVRLSDDTLPCSGVKIVIPELEE
ncbi:hypothetical protein ACC781_38245, partial [Rhizobium ruizarguesonis]